MKLLLDENVAASTAQLCRDQGHDVKHVKEEGLQGEDDEALLDLAVAEHRVMLSFDKDFGNLLRFPLASHLGVIVVALRDQRPHRVNERLLQLLPVFSAIDLTGKLIVVRDGDVRFVQSPLKGACVRKRGLHARRAACGDGQRPRHGVRSAAGGVRRIRERRMTNTAAVRMARGECPGRLSGEQQTPSGGPTSVPVG